jgi:hypothetical protein
VIVTPKAQSSTEVSKSEVICHSENKMGSLLPVKVCATRRQFEQRTQEDQANLRDWQRPAPLKSN